MKNKNPHRYKNGDEDKFTGVDTNFIINRGGSLWVR